MQTKTLKLVSVLFFALSTAAYSQLLYPSDLQKVSTPWTDFPYDSVLVHTWRGIKARNIDAYGTDMMVHRPKSEDPGDAVSEGISYGMFLALYSNDQNYFNKIWNAGEKYMLSGGGNFYNWRIGSNGNLAGSGPASDADQDIALLLIFADELVKAGIWNGGYTSDRGATYKKRASDLLQNVRESMTATNGSNRYLLPWSGGGINHLNPGYFAPAFYRIFAEFDSPNRSAWLALVEGSYEVIGNSKGYNNGLLPDWCGWNGDYTSGGAGYNGYRGGVYQYRDAIRVYWRLATDYLWYGEPRAKTFLDNAVNFLGSPDKANFFDMDGKLPPETDGELLKGYTQPRTRREHSHLTLGMWAAAAMGSGGPALAKSYSDLLLTKFYAKGRDFFGQINIPENTLPELKIVRDGNNDTTLINVPFAEDTLRNEMYFDQFLAWFGASILGGVFTNVWEDLKNGKPDGPLAWITQPTINDRLIKASVAPLTVKAKLNRSKLWTAKLTSYDDTTHSRTFSAASDTVDFSWYGLSQNGEYMNRGWYRLDITAGSLSYSKNVWLGQPYTKNLIENGRLLVDDFASGTYTSPYIGNDWRGVTDGNGTTVTPSIGGSGDKKWLSWDYNIGTGGYPYAGIDWNCGNTSSTFDLTGIDSIIIFARRVGGSAASGEVSLQLISEDIKNSSCNYCYFEDSLYLTATAEKFSLYIPDFKQRLNGNGNQIANTLNTMTAIRFHIQTNEGTSGTIVIEKMYFTGDFSNFYSYVAPPPYLEPTPEPPLGVATSRVSPSQKFSLRKSGSQFILTMRPNMAGADARIVNVKGVVVKRAKVPKSGQLAISSRELGSGIYFIDVKKAGAANIRVPLGNVK